MSRDAGTVVDAEEKGRRVEKCRAGVYGGESGRGSAGAVQAGEGKGRVDNMIVWGKARG